MHPIRLFLCLLAGASLIAGLEARPHVNEPHNFLQPDRSTVPVLVSGDQYFQKVTTPSGDLLVRDPQGWICFASISADGLRIEPTSVRYTGQTGYIRHSKPTDTIPLKPAGIEGIRQAAINRRGDWSDVRPMGNHTLHGRAIDNQHQTHSIRTGNSRSTVRTVYGLTILIDFPDCQSEITPHQIVAFMNGEGYNEFGNARSVREQFLWVSGGLLDYHNHVTAFIRAPHPKSYYDSHFIVNNLSQYEDAAAFRDEMDKRLDSLIDFALGKLRDSGFDFNQLSVDADGNFLALNILYAGNPEAGWSLGLWPHMAPFSGSFDFEGRTFAVYQITNLGRDLSLGVVVHENEHMLMGWPDTYAYNGERDDFIDWVIPFDYKNPQINNPFFRDMAGWLHVTDISNALSGQQFTLQANGPQALIYSGETGHSRHHHYYIEARKNGVPVHFGHTSNLDEGIIIWEVNLEGSNMDVNLPKQIDVVAASQSHSGFKPETSTRFNAVEQPQAYWSNGMPSGIDIGDISPVGDHMTVTIGSPFVHVANPLARVFLHTPFSIQLKGSGGAGAPYTFRAHAGGLPAGYHINRNGILSGSISNSGTSTVQVVVADRNGNSSFRTISLKANGLPIYMLSRFHQHEPQMIFVDENVKAELTSDVSPVDSIFYTPHWRNEGIAFGAHTGPLTGAKPVYRFFNTASGSHFFTISETERSFLANTPGSPFTLEGVAFYCYDYPAPDTIPIHRLRVTRPDGSDAHIFAPGDLIRDLIIEQLPFGADPEGVAWYALQW